MKNRYEVAALLLAFAMVQPMAMCAVDTDPATEKLEQDMKTAVLNGSITIAQVKQLQASAATLKAARTEHQPGAPVDLLTPYHAVSSMKAVMATVAPKDKQMLREDLDAVLATKQTATAATPPTPGQKLGKDIFKAVMFGTPTEAQVTQLQDSLNSLEKLKEDRGGPLQALRALRGAKSQIEVVMNAGSFRAEDRQAVLDDLNNLGSGGGGRRG
jgi:hypothetical protein